MNEQEIEIINYNKLGEGYKINKPKIIKEENLEKILDNNNSDKIIITTRVIEKYIIIISTKVKNMLELNNKKAKDIQLDSFNITIIEYNSTNNKFQQIMINIPIKGDVKISKKIFFNQKFYFFDLIPIDNNKSFFILYLFEQLHFFKLYKKEELLKYNKIKVKNFNKETSVSYISKNIIKNKNILEIELLLKPKNSFYFIPIDISDANKKLEEKEYYLKDVENKNIFHKIIKSNCDMLIFTDKNTNQNYIVTKDNNSSEITMKELIINNEENNKQHQNLTILFLFKISDKIYIISHITNNKEEDEENKYSVFGIYNIIYVEKDNNYNMELFQEIKILNNEGIKEYKFNMNNSNNIFINYGMKLYIFYLEKNGVIDMINLFQLDSNLNFDKIFYDKYQETTLLITILNNDIFCSKNIDEYFQDKKYISNENKNNIEEDDSNNEEKNESIDKKDLINEKLNEKDEEDKQKSEIILQKLINENNNSGINIEIDKIISQRIEFNAKKLNKFAKDNKNKFKLIKEDIKLQKQQYQLFKEKHDTILKVITALKKIKNDNNKYYNEFAEEEEDEIDNNMNYNYNNNYYPYQRASTQNYNNNFNFQNILPYNNQNKFYN